MKGILYGVGVGPGDPEYITLKALNLVKENDVIAVAGKDAKEAVAYKIVEATYPEIADKEIVPVYMPMVMDREEQKKNHQKGARLLEKYLDEGKNVVYITLGDSTIYCTFSYLQEIVEEDGYQTQLVAGIPSFCAAAARVNQPLVLWNAPLHIVPALHKKEETLSLPGNYVFMQSGSHMSEVKEIFRESGRDVFDVENCGMPDEKVYMSVDEIPEDAGYFSLIVAKEKPNYD